MTSLDAELLFTKIFLEETIKNCLNDLFSINFYNDKLTRKDLYDLLKLATTESSFIFENKFYKQIYRVVMGSAFATTLASAFYVIMAKFGLINTCHNLSL